MQIGVKMKRNTAELKEKLITTGSGRDNSKRNRTTIYMEGAK